MRCHRLLAAFAFSLVFIPAWAFGQGLRLTPIDRATTFAICEYVDAPGIVDELVQSGVEVVLRGYFKWSSDPADWSGIAAGVTQLHNAGIPVIGGFTASTFFLYEDGTTEDQFNDFVTRDAQGNVVILWDPQGAHYANSNPAVVDFLLEHARRQIEAGLDGFHIDEPQYIEGPNWNLGNEGYDDYAMTAFRDYLANKYPDYTEEDWKQKFGIDDIATFNYRDYLATYGWADYPFFSFLINPLFFEWEPLLGWFDPLRLFTADPETMYSENNFHGHATRHYLENLVNGIKALSQEYTRRLDVCVNGISPYVDFQMTFILAPFPFSWSLIEWFRQDRESSRALLGREAPIVFFLDWPGGMEWYSEFTEQKKRDYIRIFSAEAYASGCHYAFHFLNYLQDFRTNGTHDLVYHLVDWFKGHAALYHGLAEHPSWRKVQADNRHVAHTLWYDVEKNLALLHLINHNYASQGMTPVNDLHVTVPIGNVLSATLISPDFAGEVPLSFQSTDSGTTLAIPYLEFYDVVVMDYEEYPADDDIADDDLSDDDTVDDDTVDDDTVNDDTADDDTTEDDTDDDTADDDAVKDDDSGAGEDETDDDAEDDDDDGGDGGKSGCGC